ncbi:hypothetical protein [Streptomyces sp. CA2R101]|uniref:hypothetical protein n=1 Tax=Streptomyces sp. CA2R101 TaxID=3120152 RepID=UPI00300A38ED
MSTAVGGGGGHGLLGHGGTFLWAGATEEPAGGFYVACSHGRMGQPQALIPLSSTMAVYAEEWPAATVFA